MWCVCTMTLPCSVFHLLWRPCAPGAQCASFDQSCGCELPPTCTSILGRAHTQGYCPLCASIGCVFCQRESWRFLAICQRQLKKLSYILLQKRLMTYQTDVIITCWLSLLVLASIWLLIRFRLHVIFVLLARLALFLRKLWRVSIITS